VFSALKHPFQYELTKTALQVFSPEQSVACFLSRFFICQYWFNAFVILASHARSFATSNNSTAAKYLTLFG
jgi:hypothetical protein